MAQPEDEPHDPGEEPLVDEPVSEIVERVGRDSGTLVFRELQLRGARHLPELRRAGRDVVAATVAVVALVTAFALANWAAVAALSNILASWLAPLVLAAGWALIGILLVLSLRHRVRGLGPWTGKQTDLVGERERAREEAEVELRATLDVLAGAIAAEAGGLVRDVVGSAAEGAVDASEDILDAADDFTDEIAETVPGGSLVNGVLDLALLPGRTFVRVAKVTIRRDIEDEGPKGPDTT